MAEMRVQVEGTTQVAGTVTTTPSGTQNVAVTGQPISVTPSNTSGAPVYTVDIPNPSPPATFVFSTAELPGVVAANNHLTLYNAVGSGKNVFLGGIFISTYAVADIAVTAVSMRGYRIASAPSGGTLQATSAYGKFITASAAPTAEIRTGTVTATLGDALFNSPPSMAGAKAGANYVHSVAIPSPFLLTPGEGIVLRTEAGDVDQRWNLSVAWAEV